MVVGTIRSDRVVRKDLEADDRLPLSCPRGSCRRDGWLKPYSNPTGIDRYRENTGSTTPPRLDLLRVCPLYQPSNRRSVFLPPPSDWGQRAAMKPVQSERYGQFASRVEGFRGRRALAAGLTWGGSRYVGGSAATPTQCGLIVAGGCPPTGIPHLDRTVTSANVPKGPMDSFSQRGI